MFRRTYLAFAAPAVLGVAIVTGCSQQQAAPTPSAGSPDSSSDEASSGKIETAMSKLSAEDRL
ncbi:MAG TPA: hypothetical protein PKC18_08465, partial [Lacipirellulaceae bacterium]|nr:hypothetical protein [Lacipirellulaceae bacterium]